MMQRCARAVDQAFNASFTVTIKPLVASPPAHAKAPTDHCKCLILSLNRQHKAHPLIHRTGLHPSHRQGPPRRSVDLLPMSPVYSVTHVAGLDHPDLLPARGEKGRAVRRGTSLNSHSHGLAWLMNFSGGASP